MRIKNEANFFMRKLDTFPALYQRGIVPLWTVEVSMVRKPKVNHTNSNLKQVISNSQFNFGYVYIE